MQSALYLYIIWTKSKIQHGGRRQGAGRKAISDEDKKVTITFSMSPDLKRRLQIAADARGISSSKLMAEILDANLPKENSEYNTPEYTYSKGCKLLSDLLPLALSHNRLCAIQRKSMRYA